MTGHLPWLALVAYLCSMNPPPSKASVKTPDPAALRTISETNGFMLGRPGHVRVVPNGSAVVFLRSQGPKSRSASLYELDTATGKERLLVSPEDLLGGERETLSVEERAARERKRISTGGFTQFELSKDGERILVFLSGKPWLIERKSGRRGIIALPPGDVIDARLSPTAKHLAFVQDNNLSVVELGAIDAEGRVTLGQIARITTGGTAEISYGLAEFVAQEEMNRFQGYWWSPDGRRIAYQRTDNTPLERLTIANAARPEEAPHTFPYPRAGRKNASVQLFVAALDGQAPVEITWDRQKYPYLARVVWQENAPLSVLVQSRDQRNALFLAAEIDSGRTETLHGEHDDAWLNLSTSTPRWLPDGQSFLFATERLGAWALERHFRDKARKIELVLPPSAGFHTLAYIDAIHEKVWFLGGPNPTETGLYVANLSGTRVPIQVSPPGGVHDAAFTEGAPSFVLTRSDRSAMPRATIHPLREGMVSLAGAKEIESKAMEPTQIPNLELVPTTRAAGLGALILRPHGFEAGKKYPVVVYVYGGPTTTLVHDTIAGFFIPQWIADHGFIVVTIDGRGTPRRGRDFERALLHGFGSVPLEDQIKGLEALEKNYPEIDASRVGVYGWSFGGYMAALSVLKRPDVFKVAVSGAPVVDWTYYDTHYTERYLGRPDENPAAYAAASLLTYAPKLERPLLLVHGIADDNVYFAHTLQLADAFFRAKRPFSLLPLVGLTHQVADPSVREALYDRIVSFLADVLLAEPVDASRGKTVD